MSFAYLYEEDEPISWDIILFLSIVSVLLVLLTVFVLPWLLIWDWLKNPPQTHRKRYAPMTGTLLMGVGIYLAPFPFLIADVPIGMFIVLFGAVLGMSTMWACSRGNTFAFPEGTFAIMMIAVYSELLLLYARLGHVLDPINGILIGFLVLFFGLYCPWAVTYFSNRPAPRPIVIPD